MAQPVKIKCPHGEMHASLEECKHCPHCEEMFPGPVLHSLLNGRDRERKPKDKPTFGVGLLVSNCLRQSYYMLPEPTKSNIKSIKIVYLSLQNVKTFEVSKRDITPFLEARATQLMLALQNKNAPEKEVSWLCKYCDFYEKCFGKKVGFIG